LDSELCIHLAICFLAIGMLLLSEVLEYVAPTFRDLLTIASILCGLAGAWSGIIVIGNLVKRSLLRRFKRLGAFSPETAVTLDQLELDEWVDQSAFKQLLEQGIVKVTADSKYYYPVPHEKRVLSAEEKWQIIQTVSLIALVTVYIIIAVTLNLHPFIAVTIFVIAVIIWKVSKKLTKKNTKIQRARIINAIPAVGISTSKCQ